MAKKKRHSKVDPRKQKNKSDIFNGNVNAPGEFIFIYALISIMCIAVLIFFAVSSAPKDPDGLQYDDVRFSRYEIEDDHLHLYIDGKDQYYSVPAYQETLTDAEGFLRLSMDDTVFRIGYVSYPKADPPHKGLESITDANGTVYLTAEAVHAYRWGDAPAFYAFFGGITIVWLVFVLLSIYIARHPERFSRRTIRLFFKDGVIRRYHSK